MQNSSYTITKEDLIVQNNWKLQPIDRIAKNEFKSCDLGCIRKELRKPCAVQSVVFWY